MRMGGEKWGIAGALLLLLQPHGASGMNLYESFQNSSTNLQATGGMIGNFGSIPCLTKDSKNHLEAFEGAAHASALAVRQQYGDYIKVVQKPMNGNGKCDGGFQSVAAEAEKRRAATEALEKRIEALRGSYFESMADHFLRVSIDMPDETDEAECSGEGADLHREVFGKGFDAFDRLSDLVSDIQVQKTAFQKYKEQNSALGDGCGSLGSMAALPGDLSGGFNGAPVPKGKSTNGESTITGKILPRELPELAVQARLSGQAAPLPARAGKESSSSVSVAAGSGPGNVAASSANFSNTSSAGAGKPSSEGKTSAQTTDLLESFGGQNAESGKNRGGSSEELMVQNLLRAPASVGGEKNSGSGSGQFLLDMQQAAIEASRNREISDSKLAEPTLSAVQESLFLRIHAKLRGSSLANPQKGIAP